MWEYSHYWMDPQRFLIWLHKTISGEFIYSCECGIQNIQVVHTLDDINKLQDEVEEHEVSDKVYIDRELLVK